MSMNSLQRVQTVLYGGIPDRVPVALHSFLATGQFVGCSDLGALMQDGEFLAQAQIACWRAIGHDLLQLENGVAALAQALGGEVRYAADVPPHVEAPILRSLKDAERLKLPDPEKDFPLTECLRCTRIVSRELGNEVFICGRADQGPMALANALRGVESLIYDVMDAAEDADKEKELLAFLDFCAECSVIFGAAQARAGAHGTCIGGLGLNVISPSVYRRYEAPLEKRFADRAKAAGIIPFLHICGNETAILPDMIETGARALELDPLTDMATAKRLASGRTTLLGFVEPAHVMCEGSTSLVNEKCREAIKVLSPGGGFILSPGCALPIHTPADNMRAMVEAAAQYGRYGDRRSLGELWNHDTESPDGRDGPA